MKCNNWGERFRLALQCGDDHGYAAYLADRWQERKVMKIHERLKKVFDLETEAHTIYDDATSNLAYGNLSKEMRDGYVQKTYEATHKHAEAKQVLRDLMAELNAIFDTGYHLD
jgi:hypothetical protein